MSSPAGGTADAVVIGAGHNGLVAANMLADAGWEVVVLEATPYAGGAVRSAEITAPGYLSDLCSAFYPLAANSPALAPLRLNDFGLRWRHAPDVLAHLTPDDQICVLNRHLPTTAESVETFAGGDGQRWKAAYAGWLAAGEPMLDAMLTPFPPLRAGWRLLRATGVGEMTRLARRALLPAQVLGEEMFAGDGARLLLAGCALHADISPYDAASGIYGWLLAMLGQQHGFPVPEGGAQALTDALVRRLAARGASIVTGTRAEHIHVRDGRAVGVSTTQGARWRARRAVLADLPAPALFLDLLDSRWVPERMLEDLSHFRWDGSTVKVDWALSGPVPWRQRPAGRAGTVHLGVDLRGLAHYAADIAAGSIPAEPFLIVGQMTTSDPSRSPQGTESLWAYTHLPHRRDWPADVIAEHAAGMQAVIERHAPGFGNLVVAKHISAPSDLEAKNPSLVGGALGGGTAAAYQQLFLRPVPGLGRADTPVDRLYLASASAHPGGGVHGAPGANAARAALTRDRAVTGSAYRWLIGAAQRSIYR